MKISRIRDVIFLVILITIIPSHYAGADPTRAVDTESDPLAVVVCNNQSLQSELAKRINSTGGVLLVSLSLDALHPISYLDAAQDYVNLGCLYDVEVGASVQDQLKDIKFQQIVHLRLYLDHLVVENVTIPNS